MAETTAELQLPSRLKLWLKLQLNFMTKIATRTTDKIMINLTTDN